MKDTGIGIAPQHLELIFQEFAQIDLPIQSRFQGTGLGLPLSRGLAELLGGKVSVESEIGKGSKFSAEIPLIYGGAEAEPARQSGCDLVIIDDEEVSRYLVRQALGSSLSILEAESGAAGVEMVRKNLPRGVLLDLRMPGMTRHGGFEDAQAGSGDVRHPRGRADFQSAHRGGARGVWGIGVRGIIKRSAIAAGCGPTHPDGCGEEKVRFAGPPDQSSAGR